MREIDAADRSGRHTIVFYVFWLLSGVAAAWALKLDDSMTIAVVLAIQVIDGALTAGWILVLRREVLSAYVRFRSAAGPFAVAVLLAWPIAFAVHLLVVGMNRAFEVPVHTYSEDYLAAGWGWGLIVLSVCVQPAVVEELAFRGVIQSTLEDIVRPGEAVLIAALAFSLMHFNLAMFVPLAALGIYLGFLRRWSGSLWPPTLAHFLHNLVVVLDERFGLLPL
jgi:hypothetical protein